MDDDAELRSLAKVTVWALTSMTYVRFASSSIKPGKLRLLSLLPVVFLLPCLPWYFFSTLRGLAAFYLVWLALFKLLLLSFGAGPLSPSDSLFVFIISALLPVKSRSLSQRLLNNRHHPRLLSSVINAVLTWILVPFYRYRSILDSRVLVAMNCLYMYLSVDVAITVPAIAVELIYPGVLDLGPQMDEPYRAASLREFWGRRWNLTVSSILRPTVYLPVRSRLGDAAGIIATFTVSGLMHEVMFYYNTNAPPTGEVTAFFLLHGMCVVAEEAARRAGWWRPPAVLAVPATLGFLAATASWLFFPRLLGKEVYVERLLADHEAIRSFLDQVGRYVARPDRVGSESREWTE